MTKREENTMEQHDSTEAPLCSMCRRVPVSHLNLDVAEPVEGWASYFESAGILVLPDAAGRPSVPRHILADLLDEEKRREDRLAEEVAASAAALEQPVPAGIPAIDEEASAYESMMSVAGTSPAEEFGQWAKPRFLEEQLEEGARRQAAEREAVRRRKEKAK
jgi:hypothetical protein